MDEEPQRRIEDLAIYIPFIDYLLSYDREKYKKLEKIKQWILQKKRYASNLVKTMEQSIFAQYKKQLREDVKIPKEFLRLFNRTSGVKYSTVNLCSDDDNDGDDDDDDEDDDDDDEDDDDDDGDDDDDDEDDDDVICISATDPQNIKSQKNDSNIPKLYKEEEPCTSSSIVRDKKSKKEQETLQSGQNNKDEVVCVTSLLNVIEMIEDKVHNISSNISDGEIVDCDDLNVLKTPIFQIIISDEDDSVVSNFVEKTQIEKRLHTNINSIPKTADTTKSTTNGVKENPVGQMKKKKMFKKCQNKSESQILDITNEGPNKNKIPSDDDDDIAALFKRMEKVYTLSDKSSDDSDIENFDNNSADLHNSSWGNNEKKPKDIKEELFTRRSNKVEASQNDEFGNKAIIDPEIYCVSETEDMDMDDWMSANFEQNTTETVNADDKTGISKIVGAIAKPENKLEDMDLSELDLIYKKLTSKNNIDLEQCLVKLINQTQNCNGYHSAGLQNLPTESISPTDRNPNIPSISPQILSPRDNFTVLPPNCSSKESFKSPLSNRATEDSCIPPPPRFFHVKNFDPPQIPIVQQFPTASQISYQSHVPANTPTFLNGGRKPNLKDPRIIRQLQRVQNSPVFSTNIRKMATYLLQQNQPRTYLEHKRIQAELKKKAERRNEEAEQRKEVERLADEKRAVERLAEEKRNAERVAEEKRAAVRLANEKRRVERLTEEKRTAERLANEKKAVERLAEEKRNAERLAAEKRAAERLANEKRRVERLPEEKRNAERLSEEKRAAVRLANEKRRVEHLTEEKRTAERLANEKKAVERLTEKKRNAERLAEEKRAAVRLANEKRRVEHLTEEKRTAERLANEKKAVERLPEEKRNAERLSEEKRAAVRLANEKRRVEHLTEEKRTAERLANEKKAAERLTEENRSAERLTEERLSKERGAADRLAKEKRVAKRSNKVPREIPKISVESTIISQAQIEPSKKHDLTISLNGNKNSNQMEVCRKVVNNGDSKTVHSPLYTDLSLPNTAPKKNVSATPKTPKKVGRKPSVSKSIPIAADLSEKSGEGITSLSKMSKKPGRLSGPSRVLKELECSFIGFNESTLAPKSINGKRRSSTYARHAISLQLNSCGNDSTDDDLNYQGINEPRSSFSSKYKQSSLTAAPIKSRRKTCTEFDEHLLKAAPISKHNGEIHNNLLKPAPISRRRKTCTASLGLARSSSPIIDDIIYVSDSSQPNLGNIHQENNVVGATSSSDTDVFDFTKFENEKKQRDENKKKLEEQKKLIIENQPFVRLLQYSSEEIEKLLNHTKPEAKSDEVLSVHLVQTACEETIYNTQTEYSSKKSTKLTKQVKNILSSMTERNTKYCVLCKSKPSDLVNHYVRSHKCEPYVARLSEDELKDLQMNWPSATLCASNAENTRFLKYKIKCVFCEDELIDSFINFHNHFSTHTGEYGFQCENCKLQKPFRADIQSHKHHSKSCRNARIQTMYVYPPNLMAIYLHCCTLCNFVQLNEANVHKHLREHHDQLTSYNSNLVQKYIAAAINDGEIVNEASQENELLVDEEMEEMLSQIQNIPGCKQEFILKEEVVLNAMEKKNTSSVFAVSTTTTIPMTTIHNAKNVYGTEEIPRPIIFKTEPLEDNATKEIDVEARETLSMTEFETRTLSLPLQSQICKKNQPYLWYRLYYPDTPYFGLFKCMANDCLYSTNESDEMLTHLNDHSTSEYPPIGYLDCSYCMLQPNQCTTSGALVAHVRERHNYSCFQCPKCCYRSCIPGNTIIHMRTAHIDDEVIENTEFVYECEGPRATVNERLAEMIHSMEQNVMKLPCKYCFQGFYAVSNLAKHLMERHRMHEDNFEEYVCIYCGINAADKKEMQLHLALKHPDELAYTCLRTLKDAEKEDAVSNLLLCDIKEDILHTNIRQISVLAANVIVNNQSSATNFNFHTDKGKEVPESIEEPQDLKPSFEQLEQIAVDSLGSLLNKLTSKTGLPPDILYQCAETTCRGFFSNHELWSRHMILRHNCWLANCPHCPDRKEFAVSEFIQHFEEHCRHLYVCFHCGMTFVNKETIAEHFQLAHSTEGETRFETIRFNIRYSYHILINAKLYPERLEFLEALRATIIERINQLATEEKTKLLNKWIVPLTADWLDNFPIYTHTYIQSIIGCLVKNCTYEGTCDNELASHLRSTHSNIPMLYECSKCSFRIHNYNNWDQILDHFSMHKSSIYACCVCSFYHFKRANLIAHIKNEHNSRDAPFISLERSVEGTHVSTGVVFKAGMKILSTQRTCFFCTDTDVVSETYVKHLRKIHNIYLKYHCELCLTPFDRLMDLDEHFQTKHEGIQITISCEFISDRQVEVCKIRPLQLNAVNSCSSSAIKRDFNNDDSVLYSDKKRLKISCSKINDIKKELVEEDADVEILEDDEIFCAAEFNTCRNESNVAAAPKIKLKNFSKFLPTSELLPGPMVTAATTTTSTMPSSSKYYSHNASKHQSNPIVPISSNQSHQTFNQPQMQVTIQQNACMQSPVPQANQISIAFTNGDSLQRQHCRIYGSEDQMLQTNISNCQPSLLQQTLTLPQEPLPFLPQQRQFYNNEFNSQFYGSNPMNITIHQVSTGTQMPNITWWPSQQPK